MPTYTSYLLPALALVLLSPNSTPAQEKSSKAAFEIDLSQGLAPETATALRQELGTLLQTIDNSGNTAAQSTGRPRLISANQIVELLRQHRGVAYVILGRRGEQAPVNLDKVFVIPDAIRLTIIGNPASAAAPQEATPALTPPPPTGGQSDTPEEVGIPEDADAGEAADAEEQEVTVIPGKPGQPPRIKFHFDPEKYIQPGSP